MALLQAQSRDAILIQPEEVTNLVEDRDLDLLLEFFLIRERGEQIATKQHDAGRCDGEVIRVRIAMSVAWVGLVLGGCGGRVAIGEACTSTADCDPGLICETSLGICVSAGTDAGSTTDAGPTKDASSASDGAVLAVCLAPLPSSPTARTLGVDEIRLEEMLSAAGSNHEPEVT